MPSSASAAAEPGAREKGPGTPSDAVPGPFSRAALLVGLLFIVGSACVGHGLFSWMGFSPTDEGFILAYSRRLLDGQVPHRDFVSIRPVGSALLHAPIVLVGGESTFWLSRLVGWLQFACVAWVWTGLIVGHLRLRVGLGLRVALALVALMLSSHSFPMMAWHTTDAILLTSLGLALCVRGPTAAKLGGYALVGLACVCKQNFLAMVPAALFILGDWRRVGLWLAALAPTLAYAAAMLAMGALGDAWAQMHQPGSLLVTGVVHYIATFALPSGIVFGYAAMAVARKPSARWKLAGALALCALPVGFMVALAAGGHFRDPAFALFGAAVGAMAVLAKERRQWAGHLRVGALLLALGWTASISVGYNSPAFVAGPLGVLLVGYALSVLGPASERGPLERFRVLVVAGVTAAAALCYVRARHERVYLDRPARELTESLEGVFAGAKRLWTNPKTLAALTGLHAALARAGGRPCAIIPDFPGYWVRAAQRNPLPIDWPQGTELASPPLLQRVLGALDAQRGRIVVIVQKFDARYVALTPGIVPTTDPERFQVVNHVREHFRKIGETPLFELYE